MRRRGAGARLQFTMLVLVTAATRHEATREIAQVIAAGLARRGIDARALALEQVADVESYDAVVLGSAVYVGRWLRPALSFAGAHAATLAARPVWLFSSGPLGPPGARVPATDPADVEELLALTGARGHRVFGGRLERSRLGAGERAVVRVVHAPYGDERDWEDVDAFAGEIAAALMPAAAGAAADSTPLR